MNKDKSGLFLHWAGFLVTCFMLVVSFGDPSKDEVVIHLTASCMPLLLGWLLRVLLVGRRHLLPFVKSQVERRQPGSSK